MIVMATSYETLELIASHHAELARLCDDLLERGSRLSAEDQDTQAFRERVRALGWRLRAHRAEESAALLAEAGERREQIAARMRTGRDDVAAVEALLEGEAADQPLELAQAACAVARSCRASLDRIARG